MRVKAYTQILESYRSVQLESMAASFGVRVEFMDKYVFFMFYIATQTNPNQNMTINKTNTNTNTNNKQQTNNREISRFIASGRLQAKIDKVGGVIETNRVETKAGQYQDTLKSGDQLLNRIQKLSRFVNL